jgi:hypothetical protein
VEAVTSIEGMGMATTCQAARYHSPKPLRFVWHHIFPLACGGRTEVTNLVQVCDSCHASVHLMMWQIANGGLVVDRPNAAQLTLARQGWQAAEAAGRAADIPMHP